MRGSGAPGATSQGARERALDRHGGSLARGRARWTGTRALDSGVDGDDRATRCEPGPTPEGGRTLVRAAEHEDLVSGSRFLARVAPVADEAAAESLLERARAEYPDATHHCSAWRIGALQRFSDDGEPGGTAGRPMLEVFLKRDLDRVAAVVVRWFGGRKLGAGGLVRAYGGAVARAVQEAGERDLVPFVRLRLRLAYADVDAALRALDERGVTRGELAYDAGGAVLEAAAPDDVVGELERALSDATRGAARIDRVAREIR